MQLIAVTLLAGAVAVTATWSAMWDLSEDNPRVRRALSLGLPAARRRVWLTIRTPGRHVGPLLGHPAQANVLPELEAVDLATREPVGADAAYATELRQMNDLRTAELMIIHPETYRLRMATRKALDPLVEDFAARVDAILRRWEAGTERVSLGSSQVDTSAWQTITPSAQARDLINA